MVDIRLIGNVILTSVALGNELVGPGQRAKIHIVKIPGGNGVEVLEVQHRFYKIHEGTAP